MKSKVAVVTGAASGIGRATAHSLAREGAKVVVSDIDDVGGRAVAGEIGDAATFLHLDVRDEAQWATTIDATIARFGGFHVLVNNAGIIGLGAEFGPGDPESCSLSDWRAVRSGLVGIPFAAAYASSKAAVRNHTKSVALYCASRGYPIRCNSIHPAAILTPMWEPMLGAGPDRELRMAEIVEDTPLRRFGTPEEVASAVVYLASDQAGYVTGIELTIDGGILAGSAASPAS
jgi:NAD(P)-dependent dehydrogenase (short-subunit alcohol dehydrogenase family)